MKYNITLDKFWWMMFGIGQIIPKWPNWFGARDISPLVNPLVISHYIPLYLMKNCITPWNMISYVFVISEPRWHIKWKMVIYYYIDICDITISPLYYLFIYYHILLYKDCFRVDVSIIYIYIYHAIVFPLYYIRNISIGCKEKSHYIDGINICFWTLWSTSFNYDIS